LELGAGGGWLAELLAVTGFEVTGTSLSPHDIADARKRIDSIRCKGLQRNLKFEVAAMESVSEAVGPRNYYDGVYVYEALHHAFDWRQAVESAYACLKPGGWMMICNEPNVMHTFISYRIARLSNTHEIGFSKSELICHLMNTGFEEVHYLGRKWHFWVSAHWVFARKKK
jgi:cyclopropane fatty-acyl-phospholipid synthase-like methyltransferase